MMVYLLLGQIGTVFSRDGHLVASYRLVMITFLFRVIEAWSSYTEPEI